MKQNKQQPDPGNDQNQQNQQNQQSNDNQDQQYQQSSAIIEGSSTSSIMLTTHLRGMELSQVLREACYIPEKNVDGAIRMLAMLWKQQKSDPIPEIIPASEESVELVLLPQLISYLGNGTLGVAGIVAVKAKFDAPIWYVPQNNSKPVMDQEGIIKGSAIELRLAPDRGIGFIDWYQNKTCSIRLRAMEKFFPTLVNSRDEFLQQKLAMWP